MKPTHTICRKITALLLLSVLTALLVNSLLAVWNLYSMKTVFSQQSNTLGQTAAEDVERALEDMTGEQLLSMAVEKAAFMEEKFNTVIAGVHGIAQMAENIYCNPEDYPDRMVALPVRDSHELAAQLLWSIKLTDSPSGEPVLPHPTAEQEREIAKLGNIQDILVQYNANNAMISSTYLATKSGWMIQADYIAYSKFSQGRDIPDFYEAEDRQWFQYACLTEMGEVIYSDVIVDIHEGRDCIVCAQPVYVDGEIVAVAGIGSYLDTIHEAVLNTTIGESGYAFLLNERGQVMVSGAADGETAAVPEETDLRESENVQLADVADDMTCLGSGLIQITLDGREVYLAYTPLKQMGWSFAIVMDVEEVIAPAKESEQAILALTKSVSRQMDASIGKTLAGFVLTAVITFIMAGTAGMGFAGKISRPIRELTREVSKAGGGNLDSSIEIRTGDEVEELGEAFNKMTSQLKEYIGKLSSATAEKERIRTELSLASAIQADMLPDSGHAIREREEISLYASMTPAKEVGGDFYDFFQTDNDHLVFLIADVSGKGVPASLFMVVAKTLLQSRITGSEILAEAVAEVNERLCAGNKNGMFVTAWIGVLELSTGLLTYVNAGHNPPLLDSREKGFEFLKERSGFVLAGMEGTAYRQIEVRLFPGDTLFLYTDGVTEANDINGNLYGESRLLGLLGSRKEASLKRLAEAVWEDIQIFQGEAEQFDDITMLALRYLGRGGIRAADESVKDNRNRNTGSANLLRLDEVQTFVEEMLAEEKVPVKDIHSCLIASDEIFSNVCRYSGASEVTVECSVEEGGVHLVIEDDGTAFNPLDRPVPDTEQTLENRTPGGLGIYMVRKLMDGVNYERAGGKNRLSMTIKKRNNGKILKKMEAKK